MYARVHFPESKKEVIDEIVIIIIIIIIIIVIIIIIRPSTRWCRGSGTSSV